MENITFEPDCYFARWALSSTAGHCQLYVDRSASPNKQWVKTPSQSMCRQIFERAGIPWKEQHRSISNHSGKVSCCTTLYDKRFDDQAMKLGSGHQSAAVQNDKQPTQRMLQEISDSLQPPKTTSILYEPTSNQCEMWHCWMYPDMDCPTSPRQPAAAPTERKPSSPRDRVLTVVLPPGTATISPEITGKRPRITFEFWLRPLIYPPAGYMWALRLRVIHGISPANSGLSLATFEPPLDKQV